MKSKKSLMMAGVGTVVGLAAFAGVASAQTPSGSGEQTLVDKIATKFNLSKSDVQAVFEEEHATREAEMQQKMDASLTQAVSDGKITEAQKTQIQQKQQTLKAYMDSIKDKTDTERRDLMKAKFDELKQWAADNNLSDYFRPMGHGDHRGPGEPGVRMDRGAPDDINQ